MLEEGDVRHDFLPVLVLLASPLVLLGTVVGALLSIAALWRWISGGMARTEPSGELLGGAHADLVVGMVGNVIVPLVLAVLFARGAFDP